MGEKLELYTDIMTDLIKQDIEVAENLCAEAENKYAFQVGVYENTIKQIKNRISWFEEKTKGDK